MNYSTRIKTTAIILAGGKSTRMGKDKGLIVFRDKAFVSHVIDAVMPLVDDIIIVSNNRDYSTFGYQLVADLVQDAGPLAGIQTGLFYSKTELNLVLSCDVPLISTKVLQKLVQEIEDDIDIVQIESSGKTMPLIALYKKHCETYFSKLLEQGERRLRKAVDQMKVKTIVLEEEELINTTQNINTPLDLENINR